MQASAQLCKAMLPVRALQQGPAPSRQTGLGSFKPSTLRRRPGRSLAPTRAMLGDRLVEALLGGSAAPSALDHLAAALTTSLLVLGDAAGAGDAAGDAAAAVGDAAAAAADAAATGVKSGGFFGVFSDAFEAFLKVLDGGLEGMGVPYSYGFSIIVLTLLVKLATFPLSAKQVQSTLGLQAMQPRVKELQAKYANDPERIQVETAKLYQSEGVNPLAGCLPTLVTIPVFIGLYRALSNVANEGLLTEGFFWIPSLAGPTALNSGGPGSWLSLDGGVPPLGWHDTLSYLVLPVLLVLSQWASQKIISPQQETTDPSQQQTQAILKFIPLMIGYFSLNVPSGLTLYWFTNNLVTTAQQVYLRRSFQATQDAAAAGNGVASRATVDVVAEEPKKPSGRELNSRRSFKPDFGGVPTSSGGGGGDSSRGERFRQIKEAEAARKQGGKPAAGPAGGKASRGEKFRGLKAAEAAKKAQEAQGSGASSSGAGEVAGAAVVADAVAVSAGETSEEEDYFAERSSEEGKAGKKGGSRGKKGSKK